MSAGLRWLGIALGLGYVVSAGAAEFGLAETTTMSLTSAPAILTLVESLRVEVDEAGGDSSLMLIEGSP